MAESLTGALNPGVRRREVFGWAMYDFANSGYTTVVLTAVFNAYFVGAVAGNAIEGRNSSGDYVEGYRISVQLDHGGYRVYDVGSPGDLRIGDRVVWSVTVSCARCDRCLRGLPQKCRDLGKYGHDRIGVLGEVR